MAKKKLSASTLAAQQEYFAKMGIYQSTPVKVKKSEIKEIKGPELKSVNIGLNSSLKNFGIYIMTINKAGPLVYMTDREIVEKCLSSYDEALSAIIKMENTQDVYSYLASRHMQYGVCAFARWKLCVDICGHWFITDYQVEPDGFWHIMPDECTTLKEMIGAISFRVERLQEILNSMQ
jgi:hypothetical protein